jgi:hypothetical protein
MNRIKSSGEGGGAALQVTEAARNAGLVEENSEGDATRLADVRVHAFRDLLLVVDVDEVDEDHAAELVAVAARDTGTAYRAGQSSVQPAGNGYQVQLPFYVDAGFHVGDSAPCESGRGVLVITDGSGSSGRLASDLLSIRREQAER